MPKKCIKFVPEYLIPNLDNKTFGDNLKWIDKSKSIFEIDWHHKAGPEWNEKQAQVFVEWDKHKGHFNPENKAYYTISKQRFRALLYKLTKNGQLIELPSQNKFKKVYCIGKSRKGKTGMNLEYESSNEEETSAEEALAEETSAEEALAEELEFKNLDSMIFRQIYEDEAINILEDHSYQKKTTHDSDTISENKQLCSLQNALVPIPSNELPSDSFQKRVLVERNYENSTTFTSPVWYNSYAESYSLFEDVAENSAVTLSAGRLPMEFYIQMNQNITVPEIMFSGAANSSPLLTMESEPWPVLCQNCGEEQN